MIRKLELSIVIALILLVNGHAQATFFAIASNIEKPTQDAGCGVSLFTASSAPGGDAITALEVDDSLPTATVPFFLRQQNESEEVEKAVRLLAYLHGESGAVEAGVAFSFKSRGADVSTDGVKVPGGGQEVPIEMNISNLTQAGEYTIRLFADDDGQISCLSEVTLTRLPAPELYIVGSDASGAITLNRTVTQFKHPFRIASRNQTTVNDLQIIVGDFNDTDGNPVTPTQKPSATITSNTVEGNNEISLEVTADLPREGDYTSSITLIYAGKREVTNLTVKRILPTTTVTVQPLGTIPGNFWYSANNPKSTANINTPMAIVFTSTDPRPVTIESVELLRLDWLQGDSGNFNVRADVSFEESKPSGDDGEVNVPVDPGCAELQSTNRNVVKSGCSLTLTYSIAGFNRPGTYEGDIKVGVVDAQPPAVVPFKIQLKAPGWWAALVIGLSIGVSTLFRWVYGTGLPRLQRQKLANDYLQLLDKRMKEYKEKSKGHEIVPESKTSMGGLFRTIQQELTDVMTDSSKMDAVSRLDTAHMKLKLVQVIVSALLAIKDDSKKNGEWRTQVQSITDKEIITPEEFETLKSEMEKLRKDAPAPLDQPNGEEINNIDIENLRKNAERINNKIRNIEWAAFGIALFLGILGGLYLLWAPNNTWGSFGDIVVAVLWGFGLYQVTTATSIPFLQSFTGLPDLVNKVGGAAGGNGIPR